MYAWVQSPPQCMVSSRTQLYPQQSAFSLTTVNYSVIPNARKHQKSCRKNLVQNPSIYIAVHHVRTYLKDTLNLQSLTHTCPRKFSATYHQPRKKADPPIPIISRNVDYMLQIFFGGKPQDCILCKQNSPCGCSPSYVCLLQDLQPHGVWRSPALTIQCTHNVHIPPVFTLESYVKGFPPYTHNHPVLPPRPPTLSPPGMHTYKEIAKWTFSQAQNLHIRILEATHT